MINSKRNTLKNYNFFRIIFIISIAAWFSLWTFNIVSNLTSASSGPDEQLRILVPTYIYEHHRLPTGYEPEVVHSTGNWSYAFYPQVLGALVSAFFMSVVSIFSDTPQSLIFGARLASVLFGTLTVIVFGLIIRRLLSGHKYSEIYSYLGMVLLAFWPQFTFLSSYINNDIVALFGVSLIVYAGVLGFKDRWNIKNTIMLGLGFAVCLLGYTNSYGFILFGMLFFLITLIKQHAGTGAKRPMVLLMLVCAVPLLIAGPFFVRNAIIYSGDFLGLATFKSQTTKWELANNRSVQATYREATGGDVIDFLRDRKYWQMQQDSFIAKFGYMTISPSFALSLVYKIVVVIGMIGFVAMLTNIFKKYRLARFRNEMLFGLCIALASLVTLGLSAYYSLKIDTQPQGRYVIYVLVPILIAAVFGIKFLFDKFIAARYTIVLIILIILTYILNSILIFQKYILL